MIFNYRVILRPDPVYKNNRQNIKNKMVVVLSIAKQYYNYCEKTILSATIIDAEGIFPSQNIVFMILSSIL